MATRNKPKTLSSRTINKRSTHRKECPVIAEIAALKQRMLDRDSPGARSAIKGMEILDEPVAELRARTQKYGLVNHSKRYN